MNGRVLNEYVEAAKLLADALRRGGDRSPIGHVELKRDGALPDPFGCCLAALEIARADEHRKAVCHELFGDLKADSLIGSGDQGDALFMHGSLLLCVDVQRESWSALHWDRFGYSTPGLPSRRRARGGRR